MQLLQWSGQIQNLQTQVKYVLIPTQREASFEFYKSGPNKGRRKPGKVVEHECSYVADFVYTQDGDTVVEDVKGYRDPSSAAYAKFVIKRKLMLERYGIQIQEV
nr:MAG TPA: Endonuclease [Caudoviricetes sp.]